MARPKWRKNSVGPGVRLRIGGLVKNGTLTHLEGKSITFDVTDGNHDVPVAYTGLLPDLFREGQGVVAEGALDKGGVFRADSILAKHDERYMPREVADALKKQGTWQAPRATLARQPMAKQPVERRNDRRGRPLRTGSGAGIALMQTILPFWGARARDARLMALARPTALTQFAFVAYVLRGADLRPCRRPIFRWPMWSRIRIPTCRWSIKFPASGAITKAP